MSQVNLRFIKKNLESSFSDKILLERHIIKFFAVKNAIILHSAMLVNKSILWRASWVVLHFRIINYKFTEGYLHFP